MSNKHGLLITPLTRDPLGEAGVREEYISRDGRDVYNLLELSEDQIQESVYHSKFSHFGLVYLIRSKNRRAIRVHVTYGYVTIDESIRQAYLAAVKNGWKEVIVSESGYITHPARHSYRDKLFPARYYSRKHMIPCRLHTPRSQPYITPMVDKKKNNNAEFINNLEQTSQTATNHHIEYVK